MRASFRNRSCVTDDVAADPVGLEKVQDLPGAGPEELELGLRGHDGQGRLHDRNRITTGVGDAPGEDRDVRRCPPARHAATFSTWDRLIRAVTLSLAPMELSQQIRSTEPCPWQLVTGIFT